MAALDCMLSFAFRVSFVPHKYAESADEGDMDMDEEEEDSPSVPPRLLFEMKKNRKLRKLKWKRLPTTAQDGETPLRGGAATPTKQGDGFKGCCGKKTPSLFLALAKTVSKTFVLAALFKLVQDVLTFASPQLLK